MNLLIQNGLIIDPANGIHCVGDLRIADGRVAQIESHLDADRLAENVIDASGFWVTPGWIDLHTHLREPGYAHKETIQSGAHAAAKGGFTTICCMPNTRPVADAPEIIDWIREKAGKTGGARVLPVGSITMAQQGQYISPMGEMVAHGACAFSEDGKSVASSRLMKKALETARDLHKPILSHCEDANLAEGGVIHENAALRRLFGLKGISGDSEDVIIARDIILAESVGAMLHICHVSTANGVRLIRDAKMRGVSISAEVCPHHFTLCDDDITADDGFYKMNPPLRAAADRQALLTGLADGTIDIIATDHAPHTIEEKNKGFGGSAFGIAGLETAAGLCITRLIHEQILTPDSLIEKLTVCPARVLGIDAGTLSIGANADITIIDPHSHCIVNTDEFVSKGKNTPFEGWKLMGVIKYTILSGRIIYADSH